MKKSFLRDRSIQFKILSTTFLMLLAMQVFNVFYYPSNERERVLTSINKQVETLSESLAIAAGSGLTDENEKVIGELFKWAEKDNNVFYISVTDKSGETRYCYNPQNIYPDSKEYNKLNTLKTATPIKFNNLTQGHISLMYSLKGINEQMADNMFTTIMVNLGIFVLGMLIMWVVTKLILRGIKDLNKTAKEIGDGNFDISVDVKTNDEIGELGSTFNTMISHLKETRENVLREKERAENANIEIELQKKELIEQKEYLSNSVEKVLVNMHRYSEGDLTCKLEVTDNDEIGKLFAGFNTAMGKTRELVTQIINASHLINDVSGEISSSSEEISTGAVEQAKQTNELAEAMQEVVRTIMDTSKNAMEAANNASNSESVASKGVETVSQTLHGMEQISEVFSRAAETIVALGESSKAIGEVTKVIDDIADQTNLLALNAAIEAARAGESGRGFAVVADEVRRLAERTSRSTKDIEEMVKKIQGDAGNAVNTMAEGREKVGEAQTSAQMAEESLNEIIAGVKNIVESITTLANDNEHQSEESNRIMAGIETIRVVTEQSATGIHNIAETSNDLNSLTRQLKELIGKFKLSEDKGIEKGWNGKETKLLKNRYM